jgi:hypothetical protein
VLCSPSFGSTPGTSTVVMATCVSAAPPTRVAELGMGLPLRTAGAVELLQCTQRAIVLPRHPPVHVHSAGTPLHWASSGGSVDVCGFLLGQTGVEIDTVDEVRGASRFGA